MLGEELLGGSVKLKAIVAIPTGSIPQRTASCSSNCDLWIPLLLSIRNMMFWSNKDTSVPQLQKREASSSPAIDSGDFLAELCKQTPKSVKVAALQTAQYLHRSTSAKHRAESPGRTYSYAKSPVYLAPSQWSGGQIVRVIHVLRLVSSVPQ